MLKTYRMLLDLLSPQEKRRFFLLLGMIVLMGFAEMVSVASVVPFLAVMANPEVVETNAYLAAAYDRLGFTSENSFLIFLGVGVFAVVVCGLLFATLTQYAIFRFAAMRDFSVSSRLLRGYLRQPYTWFLDRHSARLGSTLLSEVNQTIAHGMIPAMRILSHSVVGIFLIGLLVAVRPAAALATAALLISSYTLIYLTVRAYLNRLGREKVAANEVRYQIASETLGGIKEVKLFGLETSALRRFAKAAHRVASATAAQSVVGELPRNILQAIALGGIIFFVIFLLATEEGGLGTALPVLGVYAFAGLRMFPAFQQVYSGLTALRFSQPVLEKVHGDLMANLAAAPETRGRDADQPPVRLGSTLELAGVHYAYPGAPRPVLGGFDLVIDAHTTVGIVGGTGAGKTTVVDLVLGLLTPDAGEIRVDGTPVTAENRRGWQKSLGYVPQQIFLVDDTVRANIAFGLEPHEIDQDAVERAARIAELHDFVLGELPQGYDTPVGEDGVRLSGGQRQRIGIARALYRDPDVLLMDEATSALDNITERAVMDAVHNIGHAKTIILIAHRLSTVQGCDTIFMLERGRVVASGRYEDLIRSSEEFQALAAGGAQ